MEEWQVTQLTKTKPKLTNPLLIEGLPGIGNVGKVAVDFMIDEVKAKPLYSFFSYKFPHSVFVNQKNLVELPRLELYYKKGKKRDYLFLTGDIQPIDETSVYTFCEAVLLIAKEHGCQEIITTGGIGLQHVPEKPKVYATATSTEQLEAYTQKQLKVQKDIFGVVGPIVGVSGVLLGIAQRHEIEGVALLAETFAHPMFLGMKGAKEILRVIEKKQKLGISIDKLTKEAAQIEQELLQKTNELAAELLAHHQAGAKPHKRDVSYIG